MKEAIDLKPMLNAYPDSMGGTLGDITALLKSPRLKGAFGSFYILPSLYHSDLDRGFCVVDYDLEQSLATEADLADLRAQGIDLKLDFVLNHASVQSPQFQDLLKNGESSEYRDFFIDWNKFWDGCGEMTAEGYIQPDDKYIKDMFFRKPGLPILMVRFPDGREVPYWNTFYQQVWEEDGERRYLGQMDLNVRSDKVWEFYDDTLKKLSSYGTRLVRLDAFAYAAKSPGKRNFMNEPDTWDILEKVRILAGKYGMKLLPEIHASYAEKVYELVASKGYMIYDFFLPGLLIDALERGDATPLAGWARELVLKNIWAVNMLGCHDGIPMLDLKGLVPDEQIQSLIDTIVSRGGYIKNLHGKKDMYYQVNATYFSALGENEKKLLLARVVQLFMPGKPQVWYLDLFAGKNDHKAVELAGPGGHKEINRTNLTLDWIHAEMEKPLFRDQVELLRMRNSCPAFAADAQIAVECDQNGILTLSWAKGDACAQLKADFRTLGFTAVTIEGGKETFRMER